MEHRALDEHLKRITARRRVVLWLQVAVLSTTAALFALWLYAMYHFVVKFW